MSESAPHAPETEADPLVVLAQAAKAARLAPADEERATALLKERLTGGRAGINAAVGPMVEGLPWSVCVNAVTAVWEKLSAPMRRHLLASIAKNESEPARRLYLSLARGIFKVDPAAGLKTAAAAAAALKQPETDTLTSKHRQFFFNIFIGKGKPWLLQLPIGDLKAAEADAFVHCAIECFPFCPPLSQLSILRWTHGAGRLKKVSPADLEIVAKSMTRWNAKLQRQLRAEVPELPPVLEATLKPEALKPEPEKKPEQGKKPEPKRTESKKTPRTPDAETAKPETEAEGVPVSEGEEAAAPVAKPEELIIPGRAERLAKKEEQKRAEKRPESERPSERERTERPERPERERRSERPERGERPSADRPFDLKETLRGVEQYVATLRAELELAKAQLRRQDQEGKRGGRTTRSVEAMPSAEQEALTRHNMRLEATVAELRAQLEDLASHHESVAESRLLHTEEPVSEGSAEQLRALLAIKLAERYEIFEAMRPEPLDTVFRMHYRDLLGSVFEALVDAGVKLKKG